jgi:hypothetical protein
MNKSHLLAAGLLAAGAAAAAMPATAQAANCPTRESFFGTVQRVQGNTITVRANNGHWGTVMLDGGARVNTNGYSLRPGAYVGAYGCVTPNGIFHASQITLARDASYYNRTISGVVQRVESGRLVVNEPMHHTTGYWYVPDTDEFHAGMNVTGSGMLGANGSFYPQTINGRTVAADLDTGAQAQAAGTVTLQGRVQKVMPGKLIVWEPSRHTSGTWIVSNAVAFRVGQTLTATGTVRNGVFYPNDIH